MVRQEAMVERQDCKGVSLNYGNRFNSRRKTHKTCLLDAMNLVLGR